MKTKQGGKTYENNKVDNNNNVGFNGGITVIDNGINKLKRCL